MQVYLGGGVCDVVITCIFMYHNDPADVKLLRFMLTCPTFMSFATTVGDSTHMASI